MAKALSRLQSPAAVQAALDEFVQLGRTAFLSRYGFGKSRDYLVRDPRSGALCDSKAIAGAAYSHQFPEEGPLGPDDFSGGEATVVPKLQSLGYEVIRVGEDWTAEEVKATIASYFEMLRLEALQEPYRKTDFNAALRQRLRGRSKASVEMKYQNISAVLSTMELPFIPGYKPRHNAQLLLRQEVQRFVLDHPDLARQVVDAMEDLKAPEARTFNAIVVQPPRVELVTRLKEASGPIRLPRKVDFAARDELNRKLGYAGEQWAIEFEHHRLRSAGLAELFAKVEWISEKLGDGAGYDILSYSAPGSPRFIEVKTTNGGYASSFIISRNELDFSKEAGEAFFLYRLFEFRRSPSLYMLQGDVSRHLHLEAIDYRASFRRIAS